MRPEHFAANGESRQATRLKFEKGGAEKGGAAQVESRDASDLRRSMPVRHAGIGLGGGTGVCFS